MICFILHDELDYHILAVIKKQFEGNLALSNFGASWPLLPCYPP
jgi:hypothetical protein